MHGGGARDTKGGPCLPTDGAGTTTNPEVHLDRNTRGRARNTMGGGALTYGRGRRDNQPGRKRGPFYTGGALKSKGGPRLPTDGAGSAPDLKENSEGSTGIVRGGKERVGGGSRGGGGGDNDDMYTLERHLLTPGQRGQSPQRHTAAGTAAPATTSHPNSLNETPPRGEAGWTEVGRGRNTKRRARNTKGGLADTREGGPRDKESPRPKEIPKGASQSLDQSHTKPHTGKEKPHPSTVTEGSKPCVTETKKQSPNTGAKGAPKENSEGGKGDSRERRGEGRQGGSDCRPPPHRSDRGGNTRL